jgi:hypothetical protein
MPLYRATGNLVIRPCKTCLALVLHEEEEVANEAGEELPRGARPRWRPFPHHAPGGASCIGGGAARTPAPRTVPRPAAAARSVRAREGKRQ